MTGSGRVFHRAQSTYDRQRGRNQQQLLGRGVEGMMDESDDRVPGLLDFLFKRIDADSQLFGIRLDRLDRHPPKIERKLDLRSRPRAATQQKKDSRDKEVEQRHQRGRPDGAPRGLQSIGCSLGSLIYIKSRDLGPGAACDHPPKVIARERWLCSANRLGSVDQSRAP